MTSKTSIKRLKMPTMTAINDWLISIFIVVISIIILSEKCVNP